MLNKYLFRKEYLDLFLFGNLFNKKLFAYYLEIKYTKHINEIFKYLLDNDIVVKNSNKIYSFTPRYVNILLIPVLETNHSEYAKIKESIKLFKTLPELTENRYLQIVQSLIFYKNKNIIFDYNKKDYYAYFFKKSLCYEAFKEKIRETKILQSFFDEVIDFTNRSPYIKFVYDIKKNKINLLLFNNFRYSNKKAVRELKSNLLRFDLLTGDLLKIIVARYDNDKQKHNDYFGFIFNHRNAKNQMSLFKKAEKIRLTKKQKELDSKYNFDTFSDKYYKYFLLKFDFLTVSLGEGYREFFEIPTPTVKKEVLKLEEFYQD